MSTRTDLHAVADVVGAVPDGGGAVPDVGGAVPRAGVDLDSAEHRRRLDALYRDFDAAGMTPLWLTREDLMPPHPIPRAVPHAWHWDRLHSLAARSAELVPVGRGGERRAISLGNPGLAGDPYTTSTLWAAIQYLAPRESAPEHRHSQSAFRFVLEGEGVWTVVDGDPVAMRRGDLLLTPGWHFHGHHNVSDSPMAWLDGLDIPLVAQLDQGFFEFGAERVRSTRTPERSDSERLWGQPGVTPVAATTAPAAATTATTATAATALVRASSPLMAYRWEHTDAALRAQLELAAEGRPGAVGTGHAAVRFTNPATGGDALTTMRTEMHRYAPHTHVPPARTTASAVWQVFDGALEVTVDDRTFALIRGDVLALPPWCAVSVRSLHGADVFAFSDAPALSALGLLRTEGPST